MRKFTGKEYLMIDIANQFGMDKFNWDDRLQWVDDHEPILESYIGTADDTLLYAKAVKALRDTQLGIPTGFIMGLDATASGLQIMAALTGCYTTAANVNLVDTGKREDIYSKVANEMNTMPGVNVTRDLVKKPIMTTFYGSKKQPKKAFDNDEVLLEAFYTILERELPGGMEMMKDMQKCWQPNVLAHEWVMPDGHKIIARVMQAVEKKIEVDELNHATFTHRAYVNMPQEYALSLAANITHSVDGYIARELVRRAYNRDIQVVTIHDSFWSYPNNMQVVRELYVNILAEIADSNMGQNILNQITGYTGVLSKRSSNLGSFIRKSEYALS